MTVGNRPDRAALGCSVHTGWAALVAVSSETATPGRAVLDRRLLEMIPGHDPERPPFAYHAARRLPRDAAERLVRECAERSADRAGETLRAALEALRATGREVVACGLIVADRPLAATLDDILRSHALVHAAEGALYRGAIRAACLALGLPVIELRAAELHARAAKALGVPTGKLAPRLATIGHAAGSPWARDQKEACLAAWVALLAGEAP